MRNEFKGNLIFERTESIKKSEKYGKEEHDVENKSKELTDGEFAYIAVIVSHNFDYLKKILK